MTENGKLQKKLGVINVFAIASGAMISSGLFVLPGLAHAQAGPGVILSYLLAGLLATAGTLSIAELTTAMPKAGGDYFFITRSLGPGVGSVTGLLSWFSLSLKSAFAVVGLMAFISFLVNGYSLLAGVIICVFFVIVNLVGIKQAAQFQTFLIVGIYGLLGLYILYAVPRIQPQLLTPFIPHSWGRILSTTGFVFISYGGLLQVAGIAEETRDPGRVIPLGMILSLIVAAIFYTLVVLVTSGIMPAAQFDKSLQPISEGGQVLMGVTGFTGFFQRSLRCFEPGVFWRCGYPLIMNRV